MSFHLLSISDNNCYNTKLNNNFHTGQKKIVQKKIKLLLEYVVGNSGVFLSSYQESTNILKDMHKNFDALLEKF